MPIKFKNVNTGRISEVLTPDEAYEQAPSRYREGARVRQERTIQTIQRSKKWELVEETAPTKKRRSSAKGTLRADGTVEG